MDYKAHTSCLTEQEKHWGQYHKKKGEKPAHNGNGHTVQEKPTPVTESQAVEQTATDEWKGWKNEIKRAIRQVGDEIELDELKKVVTSRYLELHQGPSIDDETFDSKLKSIKKIKLRTMVSLL